MKNDPPIESLELELPRGAEEQKTWREAAQACLIVPSSITSDRANPNPRAKLQSLFERESYIYPSRQLYSLCKAEINSNQSSLGSHTLVAKSVVKKRRYSVFERIVD